MTYNINGKLVELTTDTGIMVNSRQLHFGFSGERQECEFLCILLSPELLRGNRWFYQTCIEYVTRNAQYPYLLLKEEGWQGYILERLDALYHAYTEEENGALRCFKTMEIFSSIMEKVYENIHTVHSFSVKDNADLNKWICVSAETMLIESRGNVIFFAMGDNDTVYALNSAFQKY